MGVPRLCGLLLGAALLLSFVIYFTEATSSLLKRPLRYDRLKRQSGVGYFFAQNISFGLQPPPPGTEYGPWGPWTDSSECSRTCGGGIAFQDRICLDVKTDGRHSCVGSSRRYFSCNIQDCPDGSKDFRSEQCARFNAVPYEGKYYSWLPYYKGQNPCELNCMPRGAGFYTRLARKVIDGTRCKDDGSLDACVDGICMPVGCDMILGSTTKEDECRECGGDGSSCQILKGVFVEDNFEVGYNDILLIPAGATSISIKETRPTNNYLAIRNAKGDFYLNGHWRIEFPRELKIAGTVFHYERKPHGFLAPESLQARGPTSEPIFIVLLYQATNLGVSYEYSIPIGVSTAKPDSYTWTFGDFEECTQTCGGGVQYRPVRCTRNSDREIVSEDLCDPLTKPAANSSCNAQPCPARWQIGEWSNCSHPCGGGTQFRLVFCHELREGNSVVLAADDLCEEPKPLFMRTCNEGTECPEWRAEEWSECDQNCGKGTRTREVSCVNQATNETIDSSLCLTATKLAEEEECSKAPCEGVEWILSEWSGCEGLCSPSMESREAHCANENGVVFPDNACEPSRLPELTRSCPISAMCEPMWHSSQWTECSVSCGNGVQSRVVFCGVWEDNSVIKIDESKCPPDKKFTAVQNCSSNACDAVWFTGPWNRCSAPCGGGERTRKLLCFHESDVVPEANCNANEKPFEKETCNMMPCDGDEVMVFGGCKDHEFGCCPDGVTAAGPNFQGCPAVNVSSNSSCEEADFGCCSDGFTLALGPFKKGCQSLQNCSISKYGCCPDEMSPASGDNFQGCVELSNCTNSTYGCCPDGLTTSKDDNMSNCNATTDIRADADELLEESSGLNCNETEYGCCDDGLTPAMGPSFEGCNIFNISVPQNCSVTEFGCCDDNITIAKGPFMEGCFEIEGSGMEERIELMNCNETMFGCCPDNETRALGFENEGCPEVIDCNNSTFGCCADNMTLASGPDDEGCFEALCKSSEFGCCPDNETFSLGPNYLGCGNCSESLNGCCPDNVTFALGSDYEGCNNTTNCSSTEFGCCQDNVTIAAGPDFEGCMELLVNCSNSTYGCCPDNVTAAFGPENEGCKSIMGECLNSTYGCCSDNITFAGSEGCPNVTDCNASDFGCCPDNVTAAGGNEFLGCDSNVTTLSSTTEPDVTTTTAECENTVFGCCPDMKTLALGSNLEGCCLGLKFGCCPDNLTPALGPQFQGCSCHTYPYGCCPDGLTPAQGYRYYGCRCEHFRYGCCPDGQVPATGPNFEGCKCEEMRFGCCPDRITAMTGPNGEGCGCSSTRYGCCPDGKTMAVSADLTGCPCDTLPYGCCPDGRTPARTSDHRDCPCEKQRYGCCLDGRTPAKGPNYDGCPCESTRFGCCFDGMTVAQGPDMAGCPCEATQYGCCPDSVTRAQGTNKDGCPKAPEPKISSEVCSLPEDAGPCKEYTVKWFFNVGYGGCSRFWYGGCPGNGNVFQTQEECEETCVLPEGKDACLLPKVSGSCNGQYSSYYYDVGSKSCETFIYSGCLGNNNRFTNKELCEQTCIMQGPMDKSEVCKLQKDEGPCDANEVRWYYNTNARRCEQFYYGGCEGNMNRFETRSQCEQTCMMEITGEQDLCRLPEEKGTCHEFRERWFFDFQLGQCHRFYYSGCGGNENNFPSFGECEKKCGQDTSMTIAPIEGDIARCLLDKAPGPCTKTEVHYFYDKGDGVCKEFYYGGCEGNANRFKARRECEESCSYSQDLCDLPVVRGPCRGSFNQYYYDRPSGECLEFVYSGCNGNANRFNTKIDCELRCSKAQPTESLIPTVPQPVPLPDPSKVNNEDVCRLSVDPGTCAQSHKRWFYDAQSQSCLPFVFSGCGGNKNRFKSADICNRFCTGIKAMENEITDEPEIATTASPVACPASNCANIQCPFGIEETFDVRGCSTCRCSNPCEALTCTEDSRCSIDIVRTPEGGTRTEPVCRKKQKLGECPSTSHVDLGQRYISPRDCTNRCRDDADCRGEHKCCNNGCAFVCMQAEDRFVPATQPEAARILPGPNVTRGRVGEPSKLPCRAVGNPKPSVTWWRESTMLPLSSSRFEQLPNYSLFIKTVRYEDGGNYSCQAHNGIGPGASFTVTLIVEVYAPSHEFAQRQNNPPYSEPRNREEMRDSQLHTENLPAHQPSNVPLSASITLQDSAPKAGSMVQVDCVVHGPMPGLSVTWHFEGSQIVPSSRHQILSNHTLLLRKVETSDSGEYICTAKHGESVASSSVTIHVEADSSEDPSCSDSPQFSNCELIVKAKYCSNKYYRKFCCGSCKRAGQLYAEE